jgi:uncharacterized protein (DUF2147 family)
MVLERHPRATPPRRRRRRIEEFRMRIATIALALLALGGTAGAAPPKDPSGTWLTADGRARVKVERCGSGAAVCGTVVWLKTPLNDRGQPRTDVKNPDPAKRARPVIGMPLMTELAPDADGRFKGEIYNAEEGRNYDVTVGLQAANELSVEGCVLGVLCGSQVWSRVTEAAAAPAPKPAPTTTGSITRKAKE